MAEIVPAVPVRVAVLGSTGSIGTQALEIARALPRHIRVVGLAGGANLKRLAAQCAEFRPRYAFSPAAGARRTLNGADGPRWLSMEEMAVAADVDLVLVATVGAAGLAPTLSALGAGKRVALANKEVLVMAGELVMAAAARAGGAVLPIDSEHSAIWQCLRGEASGLGAGPAVRRLILTASGGAFRDRPVDELAQVTPAEALRHPNWTMGPKVTVDSATLLNKGLEVIEARWLFDVPLERIDVVLHRESIVHSLVEFVDGTMKAQLGAPDMRAPIQYALTFPERVAGPADSLDLAAMGRLTFQPLDVARYPCYRLARQAAEAGGSAPVVLTASADVAVARFLDGQIQFTGIAEVVERCLAAHEVVASPSLEQLLHIDRWARDYSARVG